MTIEAMPVGVRCNLACTYCYQETIREAPEDKYDVDRMLPVLERLSGKSGYIVFGGEPLMTPIGDLERFLAHSFELSGSSGIQTNASLITEAHYDLFLKYNTHVGVSIDGPDELNDARRLGTIEATRAATEKSNVALAQLLKRKVPCSLIVTLHKLNAVNDTSGHGRLERLIKWLIRLVCKGLRDVRLHLLEVDSPGAAELKLTDQEAIDAMLTLHGAEPVIGCHFDVFKDMLALLRGEDESVTCIWNACDPKTTPAVQAVGPQGEQLNCARTYKTQTSWMKADQTTYERQAVLHSTPYQDGGCSGCRFFLMCKGQCPGEAMNGDPRNRSSNCRVWYGVFESLEQALVRTRVLPVSLFPLREMIEKAMLHEWSEDRSCTIKRAVSIAAHGYIGSGYDGTVNTHGDQHGDHTDHGNGRS